MPPGRIQDANWLAYVASCVHSSGRVLWLRGDYRQLKTNRGMRMHRLGHVGSTPWLPSVRLTGVAHWLRPQCVSIGRPAGMCVELCEVRTPMF